ncbi:hypothetical protein SDC9_193530 [bioreactor metagenome]|uniref:Uncharacterized protein n=1 Tax=bioreactor metagenome TaxID=1076179 RepID=A0A645I3T5_9ZZZZ
MQCCRLLELLKFIAGQMQNRPQRRAKIADAGRVLLFARVFCMHGVDQRIQHLPVFGFAAYGFIFIHGVFRVQYDFVQCLFHAGFCGKACGDTALYGGHL